jgi:CubicO group peptidase (beta-lactamase class C family)
METISKLINRWVQDKRIPGAVLDVRFKGRQQVQASYGSAELTTLYDVASLTKVVVTLPAIMNLLQASKLSLSDPVQQYIPEFRHDKVTIGHCLQHTSGLPSSLPGYRERYAARDVRQEILSQALDFEPGERVQYSDLGMILAGWLISRISGKSLDVFAKDGIFKKLGMTDSCFNPPAAWKDRIAPTEWDGSKYIAGEVHDETCYRLGGVSGSAGLFSSAGDLSLYAQCWLYPERYSLLTRGWIESCTKSPFEGRGIGWQVQDGRDSTLACGPGWPIGSFGHTGFTGTSLWIDPVREITVVFLTNAVHYGRDNPIKQLRPILHEAVMASLID